MAKFEGKVSFTVTLTVDVVVAHPNNSECEDFDEDALVEEIAESTKDIVDEISDLVQKNLSTIKKVCPAVREIEVDDNNDTDVDEWSQIEE